MPTDFAEIIPPTATAIPSGLVGARSTIDLNAETVKNSPRGEPASFAALDPLLSIGQVVRLTSYSKSSIYRKIEDGTFPPPRKIGRSADPKRGRVAWRASDLRSWLESLPKAA